VVHGAVFAAHPATRLRRDVTVGPAEELFDGVRNQPEHGGMDPLIDEARATASAARLDELGYDYRYWLLFGRGHEAGGFAYDCVYRDMATAAVRNRQPARVTYTVDTRLDMADPASGLDLRFDSAYWVEEIRARDAATLATVDATSLALPRFEEEVESIDRVLDSLASGADLCGPNPAVRSGDTWRERGIVRHLGAELPPANALEVSRQGDRVLSREDRERKAFRRSDVAVPRQRRR